MKIKKRKIVKVIAGDATLQSAYYDGKGNYCVIGGLLHAAGYSMRHLKHIRWNSVSWLSWEAIKLLWDEYGLTYLNLQSLQRVNDSFRTTEKRRTALKQKLKVL